MGWGDVISIGLGLGNAAINASNASTLQQMKMQQAGEALYREFIGAIRNGIFNLNQTAEDVLRGEATAPLTAAGAMRILDYQLTTSGVTLDLFTDLADKKFAADTVRLISSNSSRMYAALDKAEQTQIDQLVEHVRRLPDCHYYLEKADDASRLREAMSVVEYGGNVRQTGCFYTIAAMVGVFLLGAIASVLGDFGSLVMIAGVIVLAVVGFKLAGKRTKVDAAKKTVKALEGNVDLQRFHLLEQQFKTPNEAKQSQKQSEQYVENFFSDYTLLQDGWRS